MTALTRGLRVNVGYDYDYYACVQNIVCPFFHRHEKTLRQREIKRKV